MELAAASPRAAAVKEARAMSAPAPARNTQTGPEATGAYVPHLATGGGHVLAR